MRITVRRDEILHMGLPYSVSVDYKEIARFDRAVNAIYYAHACHRAAWGRDAELVIEEGTSS